MRSTPAFSMVALRASKRVTSTLPDTYVLSVVTRRLLSVTYPNIARSGERITWRTFWVLIPCQYPRVSQPVALVVTSTWSRAFQGLF